MTTSPQPPRALPQASAPQHQPFPGQQAPVAQQHPQQVPPAFIQFTTQGSVMTSSFIPPRVTCNGYPVTVPNSGTTTIPIQPGRIAVEAHMRYIWGPYGRAGLHLSLHPGQTVPVYYAPPLSQWAEGRMGIEPQERQGLAACITIIALAVGIPLAAFAAVIAAVVLVG